MFCFFANEECPHFGLLNFLGFYNDRCGRRRMTRTPVPLACDIACTSWAIDSKLGFQEDSKCSYKVKDVWRLRRASLPTTEFQQL